MLYPENYKQAVNTFSTSQGCLSIVHYSCYFNFFTHFCAASKAKSYIGITLCGILSVRLSDSLCFCWGHMCSAEWMMVNVFYPSVCPSVYCAICLLCHILKHWAIDTSVCLIHEYLNTVNLVIFIGGNCWQDLSRWDNFHDISPFSVIKSYRFHFPAGKNFGKEGNKAKTWKLTPMWKIPRLQYHTLPWCLMNEKNLKYFVTSWYYCM